MWLQNPESRASIDFPFANFELLVRTGKLYKFMANHFAGHFIMKDGFDRFDTRNKTKTEMLRIMYFDHKKAEYHFYKPFKRFKQIFPSVAKIITVLKSKRYQDFPVLLQKLEAQILLREIALRVSKELPEAPLFTIHDSMLTTVKYRAHVKQIMIEVYRKHLGFNPAIEDKDLDPVSADLEKGSYCSRKLEEAKLPREEKDVTGYLQPVHKRLPFPTLNKELSEHVYMPHYYNPFA
jgi:hypothetical protein